MSEALSLVPEVQVERCTHYRYRYCGCSRCVDQCPHQALTTDELGVHLDPLRCQACGLCDGACPTGVFRAPNLALSVPQDPKIRQIAIACIPSEQSGDVRVPCLGALGPAILAGLGERGFQVTLRGSAHCERCPHAPQGAARLEALLGALTPPGEADGEADPESAAGPSTSDRPWLAPLLDDEPERQGLDRRRAARRSFFRGLVARGVAAAHEDIQAAPQAPDTAIRAAAPSLPSRRRLTETLWRRRGDPALEDAPASLTWGIGWVAAGPKPCTGCEACARVCPTGALKVVEADQSWRLVHAPAQCVGCGVCTEACHVDAIRLHHGRPAGAPDWSELHQMRRFRCDRCGRYFVGVDAADCPVCLDDEEGFAAIFG